MKKNLRIAEINRKTAETTIKLALVLDGNGRSQIATGIPFIDHMLTLFARHSGCDLEIMASGDLEVDFHHTVEDLGICLGQALSQALGDMGGIARYGEAQIPMDEALCGVVVDISKRPFLVFNLALTAPKVGDLDSELIEEFFRAFAVHGGLTLHINLHYGKNQHHIFEAAFKATAHALHRAWTPLTELQGQVLSTKGTL
ncbi:MAG: imidazoleglycerol-phosphate dehydratase HisB [Deltaproteobacteria bacterium]|nr:imidazoleglycerol-phosphate dehydratase HisB [Candidatus Tharpella aukensis]